MKTVRRILPLFLLLLVACAGAAARANVQMPAIRSSWANLRTAAVRQIATDPTLEATVAAADKAVELGDPVRLLAVDWPRVQQALEADVLRQIDAGEIGQLGAESRRGLIAEFRDAIRLYTRTQ